MSQIPQLPSSSATQYSHRVYNAAQTLQNHYYTANALLATESFELYRIQRHIETVVGESIPLLCVMEYEMEKEHIPQSWVQETALMFCDLLKELMEAEKTLQGGDTFEASIPQVVTVERSGKRGRPKKQVDAKFIREAMDPRRNIYVTQLAKILGIDRGVLRREMSEIGASKDFSDMSDNSLDQVVQRFREKKDSSSTGINYVIGHVCSQGIRVQRDRVRASIHRVDRLGNAVRRSLKAKTVRRTYQVSRPNALWHMDGHHKLIPWGIVIHGCVDGFSRAITGLRASTNNRATTVLQMFMDAVLEYGLPSRVRGDRGGENRDAAIFMILVRGINRASYMWGSSMHNTRIERIWVEVGSQFARKWRAFFLRLEKDHFLDRQNPHHLWLLHTLFLDMINADCDEFRREWNTKPLTGLGRNQSPNDICLLGQLQYGIYTRQGKDVPDDCTGLDAEEIEANYGVDRSPRVQLGEMGAGQPQEDDDGRDKVYSMEECEELGGEAEMDEDGWEDVDEWEDEEEEEEEEDDLSEGEDARLAEATELADHNIRHEAIPTPDHRSPFHSMGESDAFMLALQHLRDTRYLPQGYGVLPEEWGEDNYSEVGSIPYGVRTSRVLDVVLPRAIWLPRSELWAQALYLLNRLSGMRSE